MLSEEKYITAKNEFKKKFSFYLKATLRDFILWVPFFYIIFLICGILGFLFRKDKLILEINFYWNCFLISALFAFAYTYLHAQELKTFIKKLRTANNSFKSIYSLLKTNSAYAFYLREFSTGTHCIPVIEFNDLPQNVLFDYGNRRTKRIITAFTEYIPTIYLSNINELTDISRGCFLLSTNEDWFLNFKLLSSKAKYIICDYGDYFAMTDNILKEINFLATLKKNNIILFCNEQKYLEIKGKFPDFLEKVFFTNIITTEYTDIKKDLFQILQTEKKRTPNKSIAASGADTAQYQQ